jgi:hypothetical protein
VRNALDRIRLRHATRLFDSDAPLQAEQLVTLEAADVLASRVFRPDTPTDLDARSPA